MVACEKKQRDTLDKEDAAALVLVLLASKLDTEEVRDVALIDIPNEFIQTCIEYKEYKVILFMRGNISEPLIMKAL